MVQVKLKWNKLTFDNIEINPDEGVPALKKKFYELTGVPSSRQKLMTKNTWTGTLKDDADISKSDFTPNQQILLMGSADAIITPMEKITFVEDMTAEQKATKGVTIPAGLVNLGNTCYLNSTVQCLRHMKDLREYLQPVQSVASNQSTVLTNALKNTLNQLDVSTTSLSPMLFVQILRSRFTQFAQMQEGRYMQQDAEEFFNILSSELAQGLSMFTPPSSVTGSSGTSSSSTANNNNASSSVSTFDSLLSLQLEETLSCTECESEPVTKRSERVTKLVCNIQGSVGSVSSIDHLSDGVKLGLEGAVEKQSTILGRNALWKKKQRISLLSKFICIHFMRFFWKATPESRDHRGLKCKILRAVSFPDVLDIFDYCTDELQAKLKINRMAVDARITAKLALSSSSSSSSASAMVVDDEKKESSTSASTAAPAATTTTTEEEKMVTDEAATAITTAAAEESTRLASALAANNVMIEEIMNDDTLDSDEKEEMKSALQMSMNTTVTAPVTAATATAAPVTATPLTPELPAYGNAFKDYPTRLSEDFTGHYELHSMVTHKGRSADSGHYIGWVRQHPGSTYWWKYDDDVVSEVDNEEIMRLKGGGDKDMTYLVFYRYKSPSV